MKKKFFIIIMLVVIITGCKSKNNSSTDQNSSATGEYDNKKIKGVTEADLQFGKLRKENSNKETNVVKDARIAVKNFIDEQFMPENIKIMEINDFKYSINNKSKTTIFKGTSNHLVNDSGYEYRIDIKLIGKNIKKEDYFEKMVRKNNLLKYVDIKHFGNVLVENIDGNSFSSKLYAIYEKENNYYLIIFNSEYMSIPEILYLSDKFLQNIND